MKRRVLVAYASRMGSTKEIADEIGAELVARGLEVDVVPCSSDPKPDDYGAVIVGSALYVRRWEKAARSYLKQYAPVLADRPTWLFQSGPCGPGAETEQLDPPKSVAKQMKKHGLPRPRTFGGRLDPDACDRSREPLDGGRRTAVRRLPRLGLDPRLGAGDCRGSDRPQQEGAMNHRFDSDEVIPAIRGISRAQCVELLQSHSVGRVAWQSADGPEILPVNYVWYDDSVVFRTAPNGLLAGLVWATDVAFEIDELNSRRREGWSVVMHGRTQAVGKSEQLAQLMAGSDVVPWASGERNVFVKITPAKVTGRLVTRPT